MDFRAGVPQRGLQVQFGQPPVWPGQQQPGVQGLQVPRGAQIPGLSQQGFVQHPAYAGIRPGLGGFAPATPGSGVSPFAGQAVQKAPQNQAQLYPQQQVQPQLQQPQAGQFWQNGNQQSGQKQFVYRGNIVEDLENALGLERTSSTLGRPTFTITSGSPRIETNSSSRPTIVVRHDEEEEESKEGQPSSRSENEPQQKILVEMTTSTNPQEIQQADEEHRLAELESLVARKTEELMKLRDRCSEFEPRVLGIIQETDVLVQALRYSTEKITKLQREYIELQKPAEGEKKEGEEPVEEVIEKPVLIEEPVEVMIEKSVDIPQEKIVNNPIYVGQVTEVTVGSEGPIIKEVVYEQQIPIPVPVPVAVPVYETVQTTVILQQENTGSGPAVLKPIGAIIERSPPRHVV
eukprot:TRINITY_DN1294_c0_g1_i2.p1 TRINITY_DN1294_c0_g1~~TRINITY_DN1294_c0_g1_i2.p1  ORF type:complete len:405 (+),score=102.95 TRINITY_DN1294_c0_g1_i2:1143-2357(+)